jgi:membrane-associated HD superfamily phosphohydrolase
VNAPAPAPQMPGSLVLSNTALAVFGFVLTAIAVLQQYIVDASPGVHTAIVLIVTVIGALGATSKDAARLGALIPHGIAVALTTICTVLIAVSSLSDIGQTLHAVIAGLVVLFASVGINPTSPIKPVPPALR